MELNPILLSFLIFFARICDVSMGTIRTIMVFRGYRVLAAVIGFFEVSIWILAAGRVLTNLNEWYLIIAYASGYGMGNIVGIFLEGKLAVGNVIVRVFSQKIPNEIAESLRKENFYVVEIAGTGHEKADVDIVFAISKRRDMQTLLKIVKEKDPSAVYTVEDVRSVHEGIYSRKAIIRRKWWNIGSKRH